MNTHPGIDDDQLDACPFCGGAATISEGSQGGERSGGAVPWWYIECIDCAAMTDSVEAWNKRQAPRTEGATIPAGWKLVPIEPTGEMLKAAGHACDGLNLADLDKIGKSQAKAWYRWRDMLAAAPSPNAAPSPQEPK